MNIIERTIMAKQMVDVPPDGLTVLSLFDGMSCGQIALNRAGIKVKKYYASEIDKPAIKVTMANYPDTMQLGDVTKWREWDIDWGSIDLLVGGSPCQGFSAIGDRLNFDDSRSKLFFEFVDILTHIRKYNPDVKFLLENVRMQNDWVRIISDYLSTQAVRINSCKVSAQHRNRLYWCNWRLSQPKDKNILLQSILENDVNPKYIAGEKELAYITDTKRVGKSYVLHNPDKSVPLCAKSFTNWTGTYVTDNTTSKLRKLTPVECERLQTVPDNYTRCVSDAQRWRMLGNGWTVDVIVHIFKCLYRTNSNL